MWLANFSDGTGSSSKQQTWIDISKDKRITGLQLVHPQIPSLFICLKDQDKYYFVTEAAALQLQQGTVVAEIIGGHDLKLGVGIEVRMESTGNVEIRHYQIDRFKYSKEILRDGKTSVRRMAEVGS